MNLDRVLQVESVTKAYGKGANKTEALKGISFDVLEGEFPGIMGASGSGKTTLLNCIATMIKPSSGRVLLKNNDVSSFKGGGCQQLRPLGRLVRSLPLQKTHLYFQ